MLRKSTLGLTLFVATVISSSVGYSEEKYAPIQAMVQREQAINTFVPVSDIWQPDNNFDQTALRTKVAKALPLTIDYTKLSDFIQKGYPDIQLVLPKLGGGTYTVNLVKYDIFADGFNVQENANGIKTDINYTPGLYYRGTVDGIEGTVAAFSFFNNEVYGVFSFPDEGNYTIVPNTMVGGYYSNNPHYLLYNDRDILFKDKGPKCGTDELPVLFNNNRAYKTTTNTTEKVYNSCLEVRVYEVADYSVYQNKGNSTNVTNYLTALFNNQSTLYRNEGILIALKYLQINTTSDVYQTVSCSSSSNFLSKFGQTLQNGFQTAPNTSDCAILFSTRCSSSLGGIAWIGALCSSYNSTQNYGPYAFCNIDAVWGDTAHFPTYTWDVEVSTHEMGHTVGSPHTHACCWNPPARNTAIDGCYTLEGSCAMPSPQYPVGGGTIMSYCHLTSDGINFSYGFGQQPGDTIRQFINSSPCGILDSPRAAIATASKTLTANRECTDPFGLTYYFNDNNTAKLSDDSVVLMIKKGTNNIGSLDKAGFAVSTATISGYGGGTGLTINFPAGTSGIQTHNVAMRRFWKINATTQPTTAVEVMFPFLKADTSDIDGSVPGLPLQLSNVDMYKVNSATVDPSPANGFVGSSSSTFSIYTYSGSASTTTWSLSLAPSSNTYLAHMKTTNLTGGGGGFCTYTNPLSLENVATNTPIQVYPNPVHNQWFVSVPQEYNGQIITAQVFSIDGKLMNVQSLVPGSVNNINTNQLPSGFYFYRIVAGSSLFTGNLIKQ